MALCRPAATSDATMSRMKSLGVAGASVAFGALGFGVLMFSFLRRQSNRAVPGVPGATRGRRPRDFYREWTPMAANKFRLRRTLLVNPIAPSPRGRHVTLAVALSLPLTSIAEQIFAPIGVVWRLQS